MDRVSQRNAHIRVGFRQQARCGCVAGKSVSVWQMGCLFLGLAHMPPCTCSQKNAAECHRADKSWWWLPICKRHSEHGNKSRQDVNSPYKAIKRFHGYSLEKLSPHRHHKASDTYRKQTPHDGPHDPWPFGSQADHVVKFLFETLGFIAHQSQ